MATKIVTSKRPLCLGNGLKSPTLKVGENIIDDRYLQGWYIASLLKKGDIFIKDAPAQTDTQVEKAAPEETILTSGVPPPPLRQVITDNYVTAVQSTVVEVAEAKSNLGKAAGPVKEKKPSGRFKKTDG
jgi:hypothetical protein